METTLQKETLSLRDTVSRMETALLSESDMIVPDMMPDIAEILETSGRARIASCRAQGDRVLVSGTVKYCILYAPEGAEGAAMVESLSLELPFKDICQCPAEGAEMDAMVEVLDASAMLLNSRKISVKGNLALSLLLTKRREVGLPTDAESEAPLEMRRKKIFAESDGGGGTFSVVTSATEEVPPENPPIRTVLKTDAYILEEDVRLITGKMLIKGTVRLVTLYTGDTPSLAPAIMQHALPFTEILDIPGCEEGMDYTLDYGVTDIYFEADPDGGRRFGAEVSMEFRAHTRGRGEIEILEDVYCPGHRTEVVKAPLLLKCTHTTGSESLAVRGMVHLPEGYPPIASVSAVWANPRVSSVSLEGKKAEVRGEIAVRILYLSDSDGAASFQDRIPFSLALSTDAPENAEISARVRLLDVGYTLPDSGSVDVRVNLLVDGFFESEEKMDVISEITTEDADGEKRPSIVIAFTREGDTLWSLGKKYSVATEKIAAANGLDPYAPLSAGVRLLVP